MNHFATIFKNFGLLSASDIISRILGFILIVLFARYLGAEQFGVYSYVIVLTLLFGTLMDFGMPIITTRDLSHEKEKTKDYLVTGGILKLFLSVIVVLLLLIVTWIINKPDEVNTLIYIASIWTVINSYERFFFSIFQAYEIMKYESILVVMAKIGWLISLLIVIFYKLDLSALFLFYLITAIFTFIVTYSILKKRTIKEQIRLKFDKRLAVYLLKESWPLALGVGLVNILYYFDTIIMSIYQPYTEVGIYSAMYKIIILIAVGRKLFSTAVYPKLTRYYKTSKEKLCELIHKSERLSISLIVPIMVGGLILAKEIVMLFFGEQYLSGVLPLRILFFQLLFSYTNLLFTPYLHGTGRQRVYAVVVGIGAVLNTVLNFILIPKYSMTGAAVSTIIAFALIFFIAYFIVNRELHLRIWSLFLKPIIASIPMGLVIIMIPIHVIGLVITGAIIYLITLKIIGGLKKEYFQLFE